MAASTNTSARRPLLMRTLFLLGLASFTAAMDQRNRPISTAKLCFYPKTEHACDVNMPIRVCCVGYRSGQCCKQDEIPDLCGYMSAEDVDIRHYSNPAVQFYKKDDCTGLYDYCSREEGSFTPQPPREDDPPLEENEPPRRGMCCSQHWDAAVLEYPDGEGDLKQCSVNWIKRTDRKNPPRPGENAGSFEKRGDGCGRPDVIEYVDRSGKRQSIKTDPGKIPGLYKLVKAKDWKALAKHHGQH